MKNIYFSLITRALIDSMYTKSNDKKKLITESNKMGVFLKSELWKKRNVKNKPAQKL